MEALLAHHPQRKIKISVKTGFTVIEERLLQVFIFLFLGCKTPAMREQLPFQD
jgi:hypothetical protein